MNRPFRSVGPLAVALLLAATQAAYAQGGLSSGSTGSAAVIGPVTVNGSSASTTVSLGSLHVDLAITFEQVVGLTPASLGLSARLLTAAELASRVADPRVGLAAGLPLVVRIEPPAAGGLSFSGVASVDVHTHNLEFTANSPLRLYKAPLGGTFADVTESMGMGSYRARGSVGGFSELLIVADLRPSPVAVDDKLARLQALVESNRSRMPAALADAFDDQLAEVEAAWEAGDVHGAIAELNAFSAAVQSVAGNPLPNVWRSSRDLTNVAGELRAAATTLRFSLNLAAG
jgi:hypothetical protein